MKKRSILTVIIAGIVAVGLVGCGNGGSSSSNDDKVIKVGVSPVPHEEIMEVAKPLLEEKGYTVEIVEFTDYVLPNTSLENGEIDANYFQHIAYLNSFNEDNGTHLTYTAGSNTSRQMPMKRAASSAGKTTAKRPSSESRRTTASRRSPKGSRTAWRAVVRPASGQVSEPTKNGGLETTRSNRS